MDLGGIERVNYDILQGWETVSNTKIYPFQPTKNLTSVLGYLRGCLDRDIKHTIFMHLGLTKFLLLGRPKGSLKVFLHGIEAWKKLPAWHQFLLQRVDHFLSNSQFTWDRFLHFNPGFGNKRHDVVHLGLGQQTGYFPPDPDLPAALIIGRMSQFEDYKGHRELIALWPQVRLQVPNAQLWIVGGGDLKPELERLAKGSEGIVFFGKVTEEKKQELLKRCRCFAMPSRNEGFGLVYLEAMRMGRPCLVSDCDAGREIIDEFSSVLSYKDREVWPTEISRSLLKLDQNMSEKIQFHYNSRFKSNHFLDRFYNSLIK